MLWRCLGLAFKPAAVAFVAFPFFSLSFFWDAVEEGRRPGSEAAVVGKGVGMKLDDDGSRAACSDITEKNYWNLPHVRHLLPLTPSGDSPNIPLILPTIGIYAIWSPYCSDIYIGAVGQTAVRIQKTRLRRFFKSLGRKLIERWRDHTLKILRSLSSKPGSKVFQMYNFMKRLGVESWVMTPIEECYAIDLFRIENFESKTSNTPNAQ